jgi:hypothetical protein
MPTIKEVLHDKVTLDIRSVDRVLLNGWVKNLQMPGAWSTSSACCAAGTSPRR